MTQVSALVAGPTLLPVVNLRALRADHTGATDCSSILDAAEAINSTIIVPPGNFLVDASRTWSPNVTYIFQGGRFINGTGRTQTGTMKVVADKHSFILGGEITRGSYIRTGNVPYDFGWNLRVIGANASPEWFGADGDGIADDQAEWHAAMHACHFVTGLSGSIYATSVHLVIRQSFRCFHMEDGCEVKALNANLGQVLGIRGQPPTTASGEPSEWNIGSALLNITVDGADAINNNGVGLSWARGAEVTIKRAKNVGRKAFTGQYWVQDCIVDIIEVEDASTEAGSTHGVVTLEGQPSGINFSLDGGVSSSADMLGVDATGNDITIAGIRYSGYNYIVLQRAIGNTVKAAKLGNAIGAGRHVVLGAYAKNNRVTVEKAGNTERSFVACIANSEDNEIFINGGDATGTGADGYSVLDQGTRNRISGSCDHSNTSTTNSRAIELDGSGGALSFLVKSCDSTTVIGGAGPDYTIEPSTKVTASGKRSVLAGSGWKVSGRFEPGAAIGVQLNGANSSVRGATIGGDGTNRVLVASGISGAIVEGNHLTGSSPTIDWANLADLWASGVKVNNFGDVSTYHCSRIGARIDGSYGGTPESVITAAVGSTMRDTSGGKHYTKATGSGNTGWVVTGTQT